jgi:ABC-type dipeptide/oligopeptide/nickel transport system permease subunit
MLQKKSIIQRIKTSIFLDTLKRTVKSPSAKVGAILFVLMVSLCIFGPFFSSYSVNQLDYASLLKSPSSKHIFGTDALGRDLWVRLLYGGRYSLFLGLTAAAFGAFLGIVAGSIAGFFGGKVEMVIMRIMDVWTSLPGILICILISAVLGPGFIQTLVALSMGSVPGGTRMIRGQILAERSKEYLEAAESINCSNISIMFRHLLPNVVSPSIVQTTMGIGQTITMAATLSYIGLGVQPPTAEWGAMLSDARAHLMNHPYLIIFPGLFIAITVLAVNLLGDGLRDALDPKLRS